MAHDIVFFLAPDDETAAATRLGGPGRAFESVSCRFIEPDSAIAEWDMYFAQPSADIPPLEQLLEWSWPEWVTPPLNDGVEVFALPRRLTQALADAGSTELEELAARWTTRLRSDGGDDMTDDDLVAVLQGIARLAASAVSTGGRLEGARGRDMVPVNHGGVHFHWWFKALADGCSRRGGRLRSVPGVARGRRDVEATLPHAACARDRVE
ncbi:hypothetical protein VSS38_12185 [Streptomyces albogriseolus]|uniref:hypothetical protein n=1 Tax=Streptomyces albogriseolus TaxID=1887 RepID=UPI0035D9F18C